MTEENPVRPEDLPAELPLFPLPGAVLFPRWSLPLNIFEPRYLNMVDDAMSGAGMIGMIQTTGGPKASPDLAWVGCAGRITSFQETEDARYLVVLTGVCRFQVREISDVTTPYRQARPDWSRFLDDLSAPGVPDAPPSREDLVAVLKAYVARNGMEADWSTVDDAPFETLVHALSAGCPFTVAERQALLEAPTLPDRAQTLMTLMEMDTGGDGGVPLQ